MRKFPMKHTSILLALLTACCAAQNSSGHMVSERRVFATPDQAVDSYVTAIRTDNKAALIKILGPHGRKLVYSGDPVADKAWHKRFLAAYDSAHELESKGGNKYVLEIGAEEWPVPIPLVRAGDGWQWNTEEGEEEILDRRIGRNEMNAIEVTRAYVEAQRDYAAQKAGSGAFAKKFISSPGLHDGLYWPAEAGEWESPLGPLVAEARAEGYRDAGKQDGHKHVPYQGYYYKILLRQGPAASGGARSYVVNGNMTGGFALLAFPAKYGSTGVMSFIVNQNGIVYERNLGPQTARMAAQIDNFNPDSNWQISYAHATDDARSSLQNRPYGDQDDDADH